MNEIVINNQWTSDHFVCTNRLTILNKNICTNYIKNMIVKRKFTLDAHVFMVMFRKFTDITDDGPTNRKRLFTIIEIAQKIFSIL